jgi:hypothetical protein
VIELLEGVGVDRSFGVKMLMKRNDIENDGKVSGEELAGWLDAHPILKARIIGLASLVENTEALVLADKAERRVNEELRGMGNELLTAWAEKRVEQAAREIEAPRVTKHVKKTLLA